MYNTHSIYSINIYSVSQKIKSNVFNLRDVPVQLMDCVFNAISAVVRYLYLLSFKAIL